VTQEQVGENVRIENEHYSSSVGGHARVR
jgi:hypothetical protein